MQGLHTHQQPESALLLLAEGPHLAHPPQADPLQSLCQVFLLYIRKEDEYSICFVVVFEHMHMYYHCIKVPAIKFCLPTGTNVVSCTLCCFQSGKLSSRHAMALSGVDTQMLFSFLFQI